MTHVIFKLTGSCNLNCSYCYVFNGEDTRYLLRPRLMDRKVAQAGLNRIFEYTQKNGVNRLVLSFHGGEPLLVGKEYLSWLLTYIKETCPIGLQVNIGLQTNGVLLDREWLELFAQYGISVGVSIDGPPEIHDRYRVDHGGRGSYQAVRRAIDLLRDNDLVGWGVLCVINPEVRGLEVYRHFREIGIESMDFLFPDYNHDTLPFHPVGTTPYADYLMEIFDEWYAIGDPSVRIRKFESIMRMLLGGQSNVDSIGLGPIDEIVVEADGSLEPLDVLRSCGDGFTYMGLNVLHDTIEDLRATPLFRIGLDADQHHSETCRQCSVFPVCGAGYLPHRFSRASGFSNPSIHCSDLKKLILHIANRFVPDILNARAN
ncbi:radical SAM protein [Paenibacillus ehimensis]|uniref:radical SAM protein n=1 Tax=Paenibacillus ehimensis TaxID=79264 RepID=UPI00047133D6|nr:radical SAM protein [Paenibacillus ehimensis]